MRVYVIWDPIFGGSFDREAKSLSESFRDKRVSYFKDPDSFAGNRWARVLETQDEKEIAWDVYLLYGADAQWDTDLPKPGFWMHQLWGVTNATMFDVPIFTGKLKNMLAQIKTTNTTEAARASDSVKIELLYFPGCPTYKQALANLKAVLRESGRQVDLSLIAVTSEQQAEKLGFQGSPSIRANGRDLEGRNDGHSYSCRVYTIGGKLNAIPTKEFIREKLDAILRIK